MQIFTSILDAPPPQLECKPDKKIQLGDVGDDHHKAEASVNTRSEV